jgi:hypothetical protein
LRTWNPASKHKSKVEMSAQMSRKSSQASGPTQWLCGTPKLRLTACGMQRPCSVSQTGSSGGQQCRWSAQQVAPSIGQQPQRAHSLLSGYPVCMGMTQTQRQGSSGCILSNNSKVCITRKPKTGTARRWYWNKQFKGLHEQTTREQTLATATRKLDC